MNGTQLEKETTGAQLAMRSVEGGMHRLLGSTDAAVYVLLLGHPQGSSNFDELPLRGSVLERVIKSRTRGILVVVSKCQPLVELINLQGIDVTGCICNSQNKNKFY